MLSSAPGIHRGLSFLLNFMKRMRKIHSSFLTENCEGWMTGYVMKRLRGKGNIKH